MVLIRSIKILYLIIFFISFNSFTQEIKWISLEDAVYLQKASPRNVIIDVYTVKFNAEGNEVVNFRGYEFTNPNYDPSKSNRRNSSHELTRSLGVRAYPTIVFLDKSSNLIHRLRGYKSPKQIEVYLKLFTDENFKQIQTQEDFQKFYDSFEYEFGSK